MKTIVSVITGRKDFPIFKGTNEQIIDHLTKEDWQMCEVNVNSEGIIKVTDEKQDTNTFEIISVEFVEL